ncbi:MULTISPECIES: hypothetical protein [Halorussus]|uniref:hypothetical protein n=1 Tax=Halorussus TaxID=1070314 RepID=UPI000E20CE13|nr:MULTISPECIES: hypothetical protein [Halorussus]NHN57556.1 hypothetical protein [Halorussus sp. JP-T4]
MPSRRHVLAAGGLALAGGAGCAQVRDAVAAADEDGTTTDETTTGDGAAAATTASDGDAGFRIAVTDGDGGEVELVTGADVATVGDVERARTADGYRLAMTLTDDGTAAFADGLERVGALDDPDSHRIRTYFEGELLYEARLGHDLADAMATGDWDGEFLFHVTERQTAEKVRAALKTGGATRTTIESG